MAGASMNDIKARIKSVESTRQITKAMELVATSKLRRAKENAETSRRFTEELRSAIEIVCSASDVAATEWTREGGERTCYIVIAGDRGLAGGYNNNIFRLISSAEDSAGAVFIPIGKKAMEHYRHRDREIISDKCVYVGTTDVGDCMYIGEQVSKLFLEGGIDKVKVVYTEFVSMLTQTPRMETVLPLSLDTGTASSDPEYEGDIDELLGKIVPSYIGGMLYTLVCQSVASEHAARRTSMNSANKSATEMIDDLMLRYNRARQAVITQEITEIVSGAEAL